MLFVRVQHLKKERDFLKASALKMVQKHLNIMDKEIKGKKYTYIYSKHIIFNPIILP